MGLSAVEEIQTCGISDKPTRIKVPLATWRSVPFIESYFLWSIGMFVVTFYRTRTIL
jgi:hypothetical protein